MAIATKSLWNSAPQNTAARVALEAIEQIEKDAEFKKWGQLEALKSASNAIHSRINELRLQLTQIDAVIDTIKGASQNEKRVRRNLCVERERLLQWMQSRKGLKFSAGDFVGEFPELDSMAISIFLKPHIQAGIIKTDASEGSRRLKYFVTT
jgi:hypothetical protein